MGLILVTRQQKKLSAYIRPHSMPSEEILDMVYKFDPTIHERLQNIQGSLV